MTAHLIRMAAIESEVETLRGMALLCAVPAWHLWRFVADWLEDQQ